MRKRKDITSRADIEVLVNTFYDKVNADDLLGPVFTKVNWAKHLPLMSDFWENLLLYTGSYQGNPMDLHKHLHKVMNLQPEHFQHWNKLFIATVDELFKGANALIAKQRAMKISNIIQTQILPPKTEK
ncbi:MAG: group III truncated hemoglobin [Flavobacterium lindanitolerans]|uniref:group III truncated hemoglobin n=1 Tax=Flavobacterium lindanitolerans TaxID=428988 RepID=UPI001A4BD9F8|nr:group III truncated hemoglobin [Flavobacterium lindanitolerans]MBL7867217.1 group III truncated hemoglobin [Flavobacterium lindanitolerans]